MICQWYALCANEAVGVVFHPFLEDVPCCQRCACADEHDLVIDYYED